MLPEFPIQYTAGGNPEYEYMYPISKENFHISLSVRTPRDAQILLCTYYGRTPKTSACYWILIDALISKNTSILRKCVGGIPDDYPRGDNNPCKIPHAWKEVIHHKYNVNHKIN